MNLLGEERMDVRKEMVKLAHLMDHVAKKSRTNPEVDPGAVADLLNIFSVRIRAMARMVPPPIQVLPPMPAPQRRDPVVPEPPKVQARPPFIRRKGATA